MADVKPKTLFQKILEKINSFFPKRKREKMDKKEISMFSYFLEGISIEDPMYSNIEKASILCNEAVRVTRQRINSIRSIQELDEKMAELEAYDKLTEDEIEYIKELFARYNSLNKDRVGLRHRLSGFDQGLTTMDSILEDAKYVLKHMEEAERSQRILKRDIGLLQGEKSDLEYEYEQMINARYFINSLSIGIVGVFGFLLVLLAFLFVFKDMNIFFPSAILCIIGIILFTFIYIFRNKLNSELKYNIKKQKKLITLLNKKNVVLAYYMNFLDYVYRKYKVRNSKGLKRNINDYGEYKKISYRFDHLRNSMYETEMEIEKFLEEKEIKDKLITVESFYKTINIEDKRKTYNNYLKEKERMEKRLIELDGLHEEIWNNLEYLHEIDTSKDQIIDKMLKSYVDEVGTIASISFEHFDDEEMELEDIDILFSKISKMNKEIAKEELLTDTII